MSNYTKSQLMKKLAADLGSRIKAAWQIDTGVRIEMKTAGSRAEARKRAFKNLMAFSDYYTRGKSMPRKLGKTVRTRGKDLNTYYFAVKIENKDEVKMMMKARNAEEAINFMVSKLRKKYKREKIKIRHFATRYFNNKKLESIESTWITI